MTYVHDKDNTSKPRKLESLFHCFGLGLDEKSRQDLWFLNGTAY